MTYSETLDYLFGRLAMFSRTGADAYKPGLETTLRLSEAFGCPHLTFPVIHIAGTNGKGSTSHTLAAILSAAGYKTGLFTSPHLLDFRERIRIDGRMISEDEVVSFVDNFLNMELAEEISPSFFEFTTVMALDYFNKNNVDIAVIEVGLGGRLDSTNILRNKLATVVTNISKDHTALLGNTLPEIAFEKAGIFTKDVPVIVGNPGSDEVRHTFETYAQDKEVRSLRFALEPTLFSKAELTGDSFLYHDTPYGDIKGELTGDCQEENAATILAVLREIAPLLNKINETAVKNGFANVCKLTGLRGRWSKYSICHEKSTLILDTGHNIGGWQYLGPRLRKIASEGPLVMIVGFVNDKDIDAILATMPHNAKYYFTQPSINRARAASETASAAMRNGLPEGEIFEGAKAVKEALSQALNESEEGTTIFVGGSTFVVADALQALEEEGLIPQE